MNIFKLKNLIAHVATLLVVAILIAASPLSHTKVVHVHKAEATFAVKEIGANLAAGIKTSIESTISAVANVATQLYQYNDWVKENILDPLFWGLANALISQMLQSLTAWVNSGFEGSPAFITDIEGFLLEVVDEAAGRFIEDIGFGFLCSPFELDIRIALNLQYYATDYEPQCTLTDISGNVENFINGTFTEGGWAGWFELTQGTYNDPNRAYLETKAEMSGIVLRTRDEEFEIMQANNFFRNLQVCEEGVSFKGAIQDCTITTPGHLVETQFNQYLGIPGQKLAFADEFNELIGAVLGQFASTLIRGAGGLLGAGGNSSYAYLREGEPALLDTLREEETGPVTTDSDLLLRDAISTQREYRTTMNQTITFVNNQENRIIALEEQYPTCFALNLPSQFSDARLDAQLNVLESNIILEDLQTLQTAYNEATTTPERLDIVAEARRIQTQDGAASQTDVAVAKVNLDIRLQEVAKDDFDEDLANERSRCETLLNGL